MKEEIQKFFKGDAEDSSDVLQRYSHDASLLAVRPQIVLFPKDSEDVKNLVKWVKENKERYPALSITARCAGTDMSGGAIGESIILDFSRYMNKLINWGDSSITVEPGMFYRDFEKLTLSKGLILPCFTASKSINAVGGMYGNNSAGERTLKYGKTENYVVSAKVVFADGEERVVQPFPVEQIAEKEDIYKNVYDLIKRNEKEIADAKPNVHKNSAGYFIWNVIHDNVFDLNKLLVGSQGTLGIATEITFRLVPEPAYTRLLVMFLRDMEILPGLVNRILAYNPQSLESYDDKTFLLVLKYLKSFANLLGLKNFFKLIASFYPEALMTLRHGFPKIVLLIEFTGNTEEEVDALAKKAFLDLQTIRKAGIRLTRDKEEAKKYWTIRHEAFNLIRYHLKKVKSMPFVDDVIVRPEKLPEFFPALYKILGAYKDEMTFAVGGHSGDGNMHIYTLVDPKDPHFKEMIMKVSKEVYELVIRLGGSITAEHNDGLIRTPYLGQMYGEKIILIFKEIKKIFDPENILNPGKKVAVPNGAGTREYMASHISVEAASEHAK